MIEISLRGDKSLSHRYLLFSSLINSSCRIKNLSLGQDVLSTKKLLEKLGMEFTEVGGVIQTNNAYAYTREPVIPLNCDNSGTTIRLLLSILASKEISATLIGDESLSKRPMGRVINPLSSLGANIFSKNDLTPLRVFPAKIQKKEHTLELEIASAQVKSALLFFAYLNRLHLKLRGKILSRDHTEILFQELGADIKIHDEEIEIFPSNELKSFDVHVPGDISSAMFLIVLRLLSPGKTLKLKDISLNPTRSHALNILKQMNAKISIENKSLQLGESVGDILIDYSPDLKNVTMIKAEEVPFIVDELPILSLAFSAASGEIKIEEVGELKVKESNRLDAILSLFNSSLEGNNLIIQGGQKTYSTLKSHDHRILMTSKVIEKIKGNVSFTLEEQNIMAVSYPEFQDHLKLFE